MQRHAGVGGERDEELLGERRVERPQHHRRHRHVPMQLAAPRQIARREHERLIHGKRDGSEPADAALVAERLGEHAPQHDAGVLDAVMAVHLQIALHLDAQIEQPVASERRQHVVEEPDARVDIRAARAVEIDRDGDVGLLRRALHTPDPAHDLPFLA